MSAVAPLSLGHARQPQSAEATRLLYERHSGRIFGYCLSLLGSREEAEDAVQTTFLNAQRGLGRGVVPQFELAWLFKIAKNVCHNRRTSAWRRGRVESARDLDTLQDVLPTPERSGGEVSLRDLTHALGAIPERQRRALLLREWQGFSYSEIADNLDVSVAAVETLLFRARRSLAEQLEQTGTMSQRRGAVASVVALFRWFFQGGAAPLKVAAVTAGLATTATLAIAPADRHSHQAPTPVKLSPQVGAVADVPSAPKPRAARRGTTRTAPTPSAAAETRAPVEGASVAPTRPVPTAVSSPPADAAPGTTAPLLTQPDLTVPDLPLPAVEVPEVSLPDALPQVSLPSVELPIETPQLPELPKLP